MRLTVVTPAIRGGGAERIACLLASSWAQQGREVTLLSFDGAESPPFPIHSSVKLRGLNLVAISTNFFQGLRRNLWRLRVLRRAIRDSEPDIVISLVDTINIVTLLATRGLTGNVVICEVTDPSRDYISPIWNNLRKLVYPWAAGLVCPTNAVLAWFPPKIRARGCVIPCPVTAPSKPDVPARTGNRDAKNRVMVAMGRLVPQKGFDILLNAFAQVADHHPEWSLKIIGSGKLRHALERQTEDLGLTERVTFTGEIVDPFPILCAADLFVFSSRFEGFGLALCEAMACGLPVVSFDCPSGPGFIVRNGVDGVLVSPENTEALALELDRLMGDERECKRLAARAPEVLDRFGPERVLPMWEKLFDELLPPLAWAGYQTSSRDPKNQPSATRSPETSL